MRHNVRMHFKQKILVGNTATPSGGTGINWWTFDYWTGHINPNLTTCTDSTDCKGKVILASNGELYDTNVYSGHTVKFEQGTFCGRFKYNAGIDDDGCYRKSGNGQWAYRYSCEFTCHKESK